MSANSNSSAWWWWPGCCASSNKGHVISEFEDEKGCDSAEDTPISQASTTDLSSAEDSPGSSSSTEDVLRQESQPERKPAEPPVATQLSGAADGRPSSRKPSKVSLSNGPPQVATYAMQQGTLVLPLEVGKKPSTLSDAGSRRVSTASNTSANSRLQPSLTAPERNALHQLKQELGAAMLTTLRAALVPGETLDSCLARFMRAQDLKVNATANMIRSDLTWRQTAKPAVLAGVPAGEVLQCDEKIIKLYMPTWHQGFDKLGRPLMFSHYGKFRFTPVLAQGVNVERLVQLHIRNAERTARLCGQQSEKLGREISSSMVVVDAEGWDPHNLWVRAAYDWAQQMAKVDQDHYPERLGIMLIINSPAVVVSFWKLVKWVLPEKIRAKVHILGGREQWLPKLLDLVEPAQLPPEYGGTGVHHGL